MEKTVGPKEYSGEIGKQLEICETMPVSNFETIQISLPEINIKYLSTDQKYLYELCDAISKGYVSSNLSKKILEK